MVSSISNSGVNNNVAQVLQKQQQRNIQVQKENDEQERIRQAKIEENNKTTKNTQEQNTFVYLQRELLFYHFFSYNCSSKLQRIIK